LAQEPVEWLAARVLEYQLCPTLTTNKGKRSSRPVRIKLISKSIFVLKPFQDCWIGMLGDRSYQKNSG
jgi:hypothetical protein